MKLLQWTNRKNTVKKNGCHMNYILSLSYEQAKLKYNKLSNTMIALDLLCFTVNSIVITLSYISYAEVVKENWALTSYINALRLSALSLSIIVCLTLTVHAFIKRNVAILKYILHLRLSCKYSLISLSHIDPNGTISYWKLILQLILHILLPYPYLALSRQVLYNGPPIQQSIDKLLLLITFFRLYFFLRVIKLIPSRRMKSIWKSFQDTNFSMFLLKTINQKYPIKSNLIKMLLLILFSSIIIHFLENFDTVNFWIRLSFLIKAAFCIGDNNDIPKSTSSQIIVAMTIFIGIHLTSQFGLNLLECFVFDKDNQERAYTQIKLHLLKEDKSTAYSLYFESFLRYKISKLFSKSCLEILNMKNKLKVIKEKYFLQVIASLKVDYTTNDFTKYINTVYNPQITKSIKRLHNTVNDVLQYHDYLTESLFDYYKIVAQTYYFTNQLTNLALMTFWIGGRFICNDFSKMAKFKVIDLKKFDMRLKEFCINFEGHKVSLMKKKRSSIQTKRTLHHRNKRKVMNMFDVNKGEMGLSPEKIGFSSSDEEVDEDDISSCSLGEMPNEEILNEYEEYEDESEEEDDDNDKE